MSIAPPISQDFEIFFIDAKDQMIRIDKLLTQKFPSYSRTYFQKLLQQGFVLINGKPIKKRVEPSEGDEIEVCFQLTDEIALHPENIPLDILYEDEHLIAVNKPPGMVVHPAIGHHTGTFVHALLYHCNQIKGLDPLRPGIVHRLDKDTSGVLIAAKTSYAHQKLVEKFANREMEKIYVAICLSKPKNGLLSMPIGRHPIHRKEMCVTPEGKEAISDIQTLAFNETFSFVKIAPKTGRTHQIRVHLKHLQAPILGDSVYGSQKMNQKYNASRQFLHAYRLNFTHPITEKRIELVAPLPQDILTWIQKLS